MMQKKISLLKNKNFDFGLVGLGVMGRNFILNVAENGYSCIGLSSNIESIKILRKEGKDFNVDGTQSAKEFLISLNRPRKIMLLVPAGEPVDSTINRFLPYLDDGDIIIDGLEISLLLCSHLFASLGLSYDSNTIPSILVPPRSIPHNIILFL